MYLVDLKLLHQRLIYMEKLIQCLNQEEKVPTSMNAQLALERGIHMLIEALTDVGQQMIDGFMMRDAGSYADVLQVITDEKVLPQEEGKALQRLIAFRPMLVQEYHKVDHASLFETYMEVRKALERYPERIRDYLEHEMGPVHAFQLGQ